MSTVTNFPARYSHLPATNSRMEALLREQARQEQHRLDDSSGRSLSAAAPAAETNGSAARIRQFVIPEGATLDELEQAAVRQTLVRCDGNRTHAAKRLGISVRTLQRRLKSWGIN